MGLLVSDGKGGTWDGCDFIGYFIDSHSNFERAHIVEVEFVTTWDVFEVLYH